MSQFIPVPEQDLIDWRKELDVWKEKANDIALELKSSDLERFEMQYDRLVSGRIYYYLSKK
jgi:hypothetical protein